MAKQQQQRRLLTPKVYEVGTDVSEETIVELTLKLADWFAESRLNVKEPSVLARQKIKDCLLGLTSDGSPWFSAANSTFEKRIKMACRFDMETMTPIRMASEASKETRDKKRKRETQRKLAAREDVNIPDELRKELQKSAKYGDNAQVFLSSAEHERWTQLRNAYQKDFPELTTINAEAELNKLCNLLIVDERQQMALLQGKAPDMLDMKGLTDQIVSLKKALNIHPEQVAKRSQTAQGGTIGEVVARLESMGDAKTIREKFFLEEAIQAYQMYNQPSPRDDAGGYQLDEIGLFSLFRCRTCACPRCGSRNYVGISIDELEGYLVGRGVLEVESPVTTHINREREMPETRDAPPPESADAGD